MTIASEPDAVVLVVEDDPALRELLSRALPKLGFQVVAVADAPSASRALVTEPVDVVLTDLHLGRSSGIDLCADIRDEHPDVPTLVMTAYGNLDVAIQAMRAGAWDFLTKPLDLELARIVLERALKHRRLRSEVRQLRRRVRASQVVDGLVGESAPMRSLFDMMSRVAEVDSNVLIVGESGTGKELVAQALHRLSGRRDKAFVGVNCAAIPENLLESELFGHVRGAFTDARSSRTGLFVQAQGGTLLLDEIGDMTLSLQVKLLRVLQERRLRPVGAETEIGIDVRLVAATHQDLGGLVEQGRFRADLLYRLDVIRLEVPPLRDRGPDVLLLAQKFLTEVAERLGKPARELTPEAARKLLDHDWPGNVRELQNCIERAVVLSEGDVLRVADLPAALRSRAPREPPEASDAAPLLSLAEVEKRHILHVVKALGGNRSRAADVLQIDRKTLYRKLDRWARDDVP